MNTALLPTPRAEISASLGWWVPGADLRSLFLLQCVPSVHKRLAPVAQEQAVGVSGSAGRAPHGQGEQPEPAATSVLETAPPLRYLAAWCWLCSVSLPCCTSVCSQLQCQQFITLALGTQAWMF